MLFVQHGTMASSKKSWKPQTHTEERKLGSSSPGWGLAGSELTASRTRGRQLLPTAEEISPSPFASRPRSSPPTRELVLETNDSTLSVLTTATSSSATSTKPPNTRVILEVAKMKRLMERNIVCEKCQSAVDVSFPTTTIASGCRIQCTNQLCSFVDVEKPAIASVPLPDDAGSALIRRIVDYEVNVLFVLSFLCCGDGGSEAGRVLGLLGLPNSTTMERRSFGIVEDYIGPVLQQFADEVVYERNLVEEVRLTFGDEKDDNGALLFDLWKDGTLPRELFPKIGASGDMGWQGRSAGMSYNSLSGDAVYVGALSRKIIAWYVCSKHCSFCKGWLRSKKKDQPIPVHKCRKNWEGSSGAMEPIALLEMFKMLFEAYNVVVDFIITDDDSSIKAKMKWSNADHMENHGLDTPPTIVNSRGNVVVRPDKGELPKLMPEPSFLADPNHRKKTWKNSLYSLEKLTVANKKTMTKLDVLRLGTNFAFMVRTLPGKTDEEMLTASKAIIEHHFDNHEFCGEWCNRKKQTGEERKKKKKFYRSKVKDIELYKELQVRVKRFITLQGLKEVGHGFDTLCNESFNNCVAWVAPKNKVYSSSESLKNRIAVALLINGLGIMGFYEELFVRLGIKMTADVRHFIQQQSEYRRRRIAKSKTAAGKKIRTTRYADKIVAHTLVAKKERAKREGVYRSGIGAEDGYTEEELALAAEQAKKNLSSKRTSKKKAPTDPTKKCTACGEIGHSRKTNKLCRYYVARGKRKADDLDLESGEAQDDTPQAQTERDAADCDVLDSMELNDSDGDFFDANESECSSVSVGVSRAFI